MSGLLGRKMQCYESIHFYVNTVKAANFYYFYIPFPFN